MKAPIQADATGAVNMTNKTARKGSVTKEH